MAVDWNPAQYAAFRGLRLRPALDLMAGVDALPASDVVDLGCGDGAAAGALRARFPGRRLVGVDASPAMLDRAAGFDATDLADIAGWRPATAPALIFSNAALQWLPAHDTLLPRLAGCLAPGGWLAVQMPCNHFAPSHALLRRVAATMFPDRFTEDGYRPPVDTPAAYWHMLSPLGEAVVWETEYLQALDPADAGHPVRRFTESTAMRPFVNRMTVAEAGAFIAAYDAALLDAYPLLPGGGALLPFRRLFLTLRRPG